MRSTKNFNIEILSGWPLNKFYWLKNFLDLKQKPGLPALAKPISSFLQVCAA